MDDFHFNFLVHVLFSLLRNVYPGPAVPLPLSLSFSDFIAAAVKIPLPPMPEITKKGIFKFGHASVSVCVCVKFLLTLGCRDAYCRKSAACLLFISRVYRR